ncbi:putative exocyst complex component 6 [Blattamonas nauphoetae]|uniref:Exocyst complex component 6 n=1 Tax=Blattamonas nauphoetae TaxID=2049346 RepID=A0ABQ9YCQ6_9EUKA|nr:putative exocyst complex component 6 [Blattamonas nauphoetae]
MESLSDNLDTKLVTSLERGTEEHLRDEITQILQDRENEIKTICEEHFEDFLVSCQDILNIKIAVSGLRDQLLSTKEAISTSGSELLEEITERQRKLHALNNIDSTLTVLNSCLALLLEHSRLLTLLKSQHYFESLKAIHRLKYNHCASLKSRFAFVAHIDSSLDQLAASIHDWSKLNLFNWLANTRQKHKILGLVTLYEQAVDVDPNRDQIEEELGELLTEEQWHSLHHSDQFLFDIVGLDFNPVLQWYAIFSEYNQESDFFGGSGKQSSISSDAKKSNTQAQSEFDAHDFRDEYRRIRRVHANYDLEIAGYTAKVGRSSGASQGNKVSEWIAPYCGSVLGYFIVENTLQSFLPDLMMTAEIELLWDEAVQRLLKRVNDELFTLHPPPANFSSSAAMDDDLAGDDTNTEIEEIINSKQTLVVFSSVAQQYRFNVSALEDCLYRSAQPFIKALIPVFEQRIGTIIFRDTFAPFQVQNAEQDEEFVQNFHLDRSQQDYCIANQIPSHVNCLAEEDDEGGFGTLGPGSMPVYLPDQGPSSFGVMTLMRQSHGQAHNLGTIHATLRASPTRSTLQVSPDRQPKGGSPLLSSIGNAFSGSGFRRKNTYPRTYMFTSIPVNILALFELFLTYLFEYCQHLGEFHELIRDAIDCLVRNGVAKFFNQIAQTPSIQLIQLARLSVDSVILTDALSAVEEIVQRHTAKSAVEFHLASKEVLRSTTRTLSSRIEAATGKRTRTFLEGIWTINWLPTSQPKPPQDIVDGLRIFFDDMQQNTLVILPATIANSCWSSAATSLEMAIVNFLSDPKQKGFNALALLSVDQLITSLDPLLHQYCPALSPLFENVQSVLSFFLNSTWDGYLKGTVTVKDTKVPPPLLHTVCGKYREVSFLTTVKRGRETLKIPKKKEIDLIMKNLLQARKTPERKKSGADASEENTLANSKMSVFTRFQRTPSRDIASLIANACVVICPTDPSKFNVDNVRFIKIMGGSLTDSVMINGTDPG